jgi:hypothetical protein
VVREQGLTAAPAPRPRGAVHSAEIEYALGNLASNKVYAWSPDDDRVSASMEQYFPSCRRFLRLSAAAAGAGRELRAEEARDWT